MGLYTFARLVKMLIVCCVSVQSSPPLVEGDLSVFLGERAYLYRLFDFHVGPRW